MRRPWMAAVAAAAATTAAAGGAQAQEAAAPAAPAAGETATAGVIVYTPDFFAASRPSTALDMINRLPGFSLDTGDSVRGFAGAAGNVVIDGARPSSKTDTLDSILQRIPAEQVERIELIRGGAAGIDMQGQTVIANVVRRTADSFQQTLSVGNHTFLGTGKNLTNARYDATWRKGPRTYEFSVSRGTNMDDSVGDGRRVRRNAAGEVILDEPFGDEADGVPYSLRGSLLTPAFGGELRANGLLSSSNFKDEVLFFSPVFDTRIVGRNSDRNKELGANFDRPLTSRLKLETVAIHKMAEGSYREHGVRGPDSELFTSEYESGESIVRGVLRYARSPRLDFDAGAEGAFNFREGHIAFEANGVPVVVPSADVRVEELRGEAFAQASWRPTDTLTLEAGARFETSTISQSGDTQLERSFFYAKPRLAGSWSPNPSNQFRFRIEREVGQLNFGDFVSSANLASGSVAVGNPDLAPDKTWVVEGTYERRFWGNGAAVITLRHEEITDVIDRVPIIGPTFAFDAPGNIGDGRNDELEVELTVPTERLGIPGGEWKTSLTLRDSEVTDPTTGESRGISGQRPDVFETGFRQDLPALKLTWGVNYFHGWEERYYRFNETVHYEIRNFYSAFIEYKPDARTSLLFEAANLDPFLFENTRTLYAGPRNTSPVVYVENFDTQSQPRIYLRLRRTL